MKHIKRIVSLTVLSFIIAVAQHFITNIPASPIFWILVVSINISYVCFALSLGNASN